VCKFRSSVEHDRKSSFGFGSPRLRKQEKFSRIAVQIENEGYRSPAENGHRFSSPSNRNLELKVNTKVERMNFMQMIQSLADLEMLKILYNLPSEYTKVIEQHLMKRYEVEGNSKNVLGFRLPDEACIYHLTNENDEHELLQHINNYQYVKVKSITEKNYFEIKVVVDGYVNIYLFLEGTLDSWTEQWLSN
jgi:ribosomal protein L4